MAVVIPAVKGHMGSTLFYEATIKARELVGSVRRASELDEWATMSIEERMQREVMSARVQNEIVPYIAKSKDRLFGSIIVLIYKGSITFEPIGEVIGKIPAAYRTVATKLGFLMIDGGQLIVLDGQHRLAALEAVIKGKEVEGECVSEVPDDDICVMFIEHETNEKTRRIFNKVNRYARPTSRGDNIITSEDDGYAIITRRLLNQGAPLGAKAGLDLIVNWKSNTLGIRSHQLTTISAVYETVKDILEHHDIKDFDEKHRVNRPTDEELDTAYDCAELWWKNVLEGITAYSQAVADPTLIPAMREETQPFSLLFKPVGQIALFKGMVGACGYGVPREEAIERVNRIDWAIKSDIWRDVIVRADGRIIARNEAYDLAGAVITYLLAGKKMPKKRIDALHRNYNHARGFDFDKPPRGKQPGDLPKPVSHSGKA